MERYERNEERAKSWTIEEQKWREVERKGGKEGGRSREECEWREGDDGGDPDRD